MLFFATTVNYLDRQVLSLTWDEFIKPEFHWDESHYGTITSVFSIVYAICMLDVSSTGWEQRKVSFGQSVYGRQVHVSTPYVE
jgi:sugar phosphate permease